MLLYVQARIATSDEIAIPDAVLRNVEQRLAAQGLRLTFGEVHCDTAGNVVLRDVALFSKGFEDPIVTVRAARCSVNIYGLVMHRLVPRALRIDGGSFRLPSMFSNDGVNSAVIDDVTADVEADGNTLRINGLSARLANLTLLCRGSVSVPRSGRGAVPDSQLLAGGVAAYLKIARQVSAFAPRLGALERPVLDVTLSPDAERIALARVSLTADGLRANAGGAGGPVETVAGPLAADTSVDLGMFGSEPARGRAQGAPLRVSAAAESVQVAREARAGNVRVALAVPLDEAREFLQRAALARAPAQGWPALDLDLRAAADSVTALERNLGARALSASVSGQFPGKMRAELSGELFATPVALRAEGNLEDKSATVAISTRVTPRHIAEISKITGVDFGAILKPARPLALDAVARLDAGWRLAWARGNVESGPILAQGVPVDRAGGAFVFDNVARTLTFSPAMAVVGDSVARGSFTTNLGTGDFRFLLKGDLRPPVITPWIGPWWADFWRDFNFSGAAPRGDVDAQGNWHDDSRTRVFISVDAARLAYKKVAFDRVLLTLFARPNFYDAIDLVATRGAGRARGAFTYQVRSPGDGHVVTTLDFTAKNIDPVAVAPAISPDVVNALKGLKFDTPPSDIKVAGRIESAPGQAGALHVKLDTDVRSSGAFSYEKIPFETLAAHIATRDTDIVFENAVSRIAGGRLDAKARLYGPAGARRLNFDATLRQAGLGKALALARARGGVAGGDDGALEKQLEAGRLDLHLAADGLADDFLSFKGGGGVEVTGANLWHLHVLGALSQALSSVPALNFTTINLNTGQANFTIDGAKVRVPDAVFTGARAMIKLSGDYSLDTRHTNITARVYPLAATKNIIGRGFGVLLVPITRLTELKFNGPIESPKWRFTYGPTSWLRALSGAGEPSASGNGGAITPAQAP